MSSQFEWGEMRSLPEDTVKLGSFRAMVWAFPVAVALHNAEEAYSMPRWMTVHHEQLFLHPGTGLIWSGLLLTALAALAVTWLSVRTGKESVWTYLFFGGVATMLINVFVPHVPASVIFGQYTPGLVTAVLINLPGMSILLYTAVRDGWVSGSRAVRYAALTPLILAGLILGIFRFA